MSRLLCETAKMSGTKGMDLTPTVQCHWLQDNQKNQSNETKMKVESSTTLNKMTDNKHYIFMLVGKTGSGRSATGNSILGENYFVSSDNGSSTTSQTSTKTTLRDGIKVTVIDTPGIMDSSVSFDGVKTKACTDLTAAMTGCPKDGKLVIVLVLKYGERFTEENRQILYILKNIFGDKNVWKSCIIIMTHGDVFYINNEDGITFEGWTQSQRDDLGKVFKDCSYRCLLYNNRTNHHEERKRQFENLLMFSDLVDQEYTMTTFLEAKTRRNRLELEETLTELKKKYNNKIKELIFSSNTLSDRNDKYNAFIGSVFDVRNELNIEDNHRLIYYAEGEMSFLNEQRADLEYLEEDVEIRITLSDLEKKARDMNHLPDCLSNLDRLNVLEQSIKSLETQIDSKTEFMKHKSRIVLLHEKLNSKRLDIKRRDAHDSYDIKIKNLNNEINAVPLSTALDMLPPYFAHVDRLHTEISATEKEIGNLHCFPDTEMLKKNIQSKIQESSRIKIQKMGMILCAVFIVVIGIIVAMILK